MAETTGIEWTDSTFNPFIGCTAVSAACDHCYAEALVTRWGGDFSVRRRTTDANWKKPMAWNRAASVSGVRHKVFCASLADVFDNQVPEDWRDDLWGLVRDTPMLDWQFLTKRPQNIAKMLPSDWNNGYQNVWLGTTTENQVQADLRIPHLLKIPAIIHFLSVEPLLGRVDLRNLYHGQTMTDALDGMSEWPVIDGGDRMVAINPAYRSHAKISWVILGAESGHGARHMEPAWAQEIVDQCRAAGVSVFVKQLSGPKGRAIKDIEQFPAGLRVRQFPV